MRATKDTSPTLNIGMLSAKDGSTLRVKVARNGWSESFVSASLSVQELIAFSHIMRRIADMFILIIGDTQSRFRIERM